MILAAVIISISWFGSSAVAQTQGEMNREAAAALKKSDAELNKIYQRVLQQRSADQEFVAALKESQRAWLKYLELHLKMRFFVRKGENPREVYGSAYPLEFATSRKELIDGRIAQLRDLLLE